MPLTPNKALVFKKIPEDVVPVIGEHFQLEDVPIDLDAELADGEILIHNNYFSVDPYLRGMLRRPEIVSYLPAFPVGSPFTVGGIATVLRSKNPQFQEGDKVFGYGPLQNYSVIGAQHFPPYMKLDDSNNFPESYYLGVLGMPGHTAVIGLYEIGQPVKGETIYVSTAAGAVGSIVGQLAKQEGLRVIGSAGSDEKVAYLKDVLGFDEAFNYKSISTTDALAKYAPEGIDIYFDNVGGQMLEDVFDHINVHGRIISCGMITGYHTSIPNSFPHRKLRYIYEKNLKFQGFIVVNPKWAYVREKQFQTLVPLLKEGKLHVKEHVVEGIENAAEAWLGLYKGENFGKVVLKV